MITTETKEVIKTECQKTPKQESCGLVLLYNEQELVIPCLNAAENPTKSFVISPDEVDSILDTHEDATIKAVYHSHWSDTQPSILGAIDIANSKASKTAYLLYHTEFDEWDGFDPNNLYPFPLVPNKYNPKDLDYYLKWPFAYNRSDCYSLFRAYYGYYLGIEIPEFVRGVAVEETLSPDWDLFENNFSKAGFRKLEYDEPIQNNDAILMNLQGTQTHHVAIMVDSKTSKSLHTIGGKRLSELFIYQGEYWKSVTRYVCRHKQIEVDKELENGKSGDYFRHIGQMQHKFLRL